MTAVAFTSAVHDMTELAPAKARAWLRPGPRWKGTRTEGGRTVIRSPRDVDTLMVHQTATRLPPSRRLVQRYGYEGAKARRAARVNAHVVALANADVVLARPILAYVHHGNRANSCSVGLEIEGRFPGLLDDPETAPREDVLTTWGLKEGQEPSRLTDALRVSIDVAIGLLVRKVRDAGGHLRWLVAHRQSSSTRRADPGEELWAFACEVAASYGIEPDTTRTWGDGRPIPREWAGGVSDEPY